MLQRTPLFAAHQRLGGKLIEFGGWEMPVQYTSITDEHHAVRRAAGVFDISHMGEVWVNGPEAAAFLNATLANDLRKLAVGQGQYTHLLNEHGGTIDDLYAYRVADAGYLLIINASRREVDVAWLEARRAAWPGREGVELDHASARTGAIALQGPRVVEFIDALVTGPSVAGTAVGKASDLRKNQLGAWDRDGRRVWVARTGYTGEDGFELVAPAEAIGEWWDRALEVGRPFGLQPCGLGARDTLRTEACFPLYGHELDEQTSPLDAGLGVFVALDKGDFVGRDALRARQAAGLARRCVAFRMTDKSPPPRPGYPIWAGDAAVGSVVSGTQSPTLNAGIGLGYVPPALASPGTPIEVEIRGRRFAAEVIKKPFYRRPAS
ncbi:MAG: glycine cleavage system aminomethyltransferase GcvT [Verrucomicrobiota bacterium]